MDKNEFETVLIEIGAHIESVLEKYDDPLKWKNTLWSFVAWFTTSSARELLNLYEEVGQNANVEYESSGLSSDSEISTDEEEAEDNDYLLKLSPPSNNFFKKWSKKGTSFTRKTFPDPPIPPEYNGPVTPASIFDLFFDDELIQHIVVNTNLYANRDHGDHLFSTTSEEIRRFIAILLLSGYNRLPRRRMYWEVADDVYNKQVADAIPRNRFELLMKYLHLADNEKPITGDKMWKIRPFYDKMNERCVKYAPFQSDLSVDESMLPYFGRNSSKQRIANKPVRMGYKMWVLAESLGYVIKFEPYQGAKNGRSCISSDKQWGLGESVVLSLLSVLPKSPSFTVFFDNFFTSFRLIKHLDNHGFRAAGTLNRNKIKKTPIEAPEKLAKKDRGYYESVYSSDVSVVAWNDNKPVYLASNFVSVQPLSSVKRWNKKEYIKVPIPASFCSYNKGMGGVDRCDQNISTYRISMRGKKWWWALFAWVPDMIVQNAWNLYRYHKQECDPTYDLLQFRREIVKTYLMKYKDTSRRVAITRKQLPSNRVPMDVRFDGFYHFQDAMSANQRCAVCRKSSKKGCKKCGVALHDHCFKEWHGYD